MGGEGVLAQNFSFPWPQNVIFRYWGSFTFFYFPEVGGPGPPPESATVFVASIMLISGQNGCPDSQNRHIFKHDCELTTYRRNMKLT